MGTNHEFDKLGEPHPDFFARPYYNQDWSCKRCGLVVTLAECIPPNAVTLDDNLVDCDLVTVEAALNE